MMSVCRVICAVVVATFLVLESWDRRPLVASLDRLVGLDGQGELLEPVGDQADGLHRLGEQRQCSLATDQGFVQLRSCRGAVWLANGELMLLRAVN